jgi:cytochrome c-type biogenesis protein CcmH
MILMKTVLAAILTCLLTFAFLPAGAVQPDEIMADQKLEARARALSAQLRCMVCQNESIDESGADLARDLRLLVRERLKAGDTDEQIRLFLVQRYGDFILLKPPVKPETWLLWSTPFLILLMGGVFIAIAGRRLSGQDAADCLTGAEQARLNAMLEEDKE